METYTITPPKPDVQDGGVRLFQDRFKNHAEDLLVPGKWIGILFLRQPNRLVISVCP